MSKIKHYILSDIGEVDISDIYDYTFSTHGAKQAVTYLRELDEAFGFLVDQPEIGMRRPEIRDGLRSQRYKEHMVFYRIMDDHIRIVRVLHSSRDMPRHF